MPCRLSVAISRVWWWAQNWSQCDLLICGGEGGSRTHSRRWRHVTYSFYVAPDTPKTPKSPDGGTRRVNGALSCRLFPNCSQIGQNPDSAPNFHPLLCPRKVQRDALNPDHLCGKESSITMPVNDGPGVPNQDISTKKARRTLRK